MISIFRKFFTKKNEKYLRKLKEKVEQINALEPAFARLSDEKLKEKTFEFKERLKKGETLDDILPEAYALVREAAKRTLNQRHFDVQVMGAIALHEGKVVEMKTGEGKTLTATMPLYLNALEGKGVHLVTVNDYLARRDTVWMGQIYHLLGLSVGCITHEQSFLYDPEYKKPPEEKERLRDELGSFYVVEDFLRPCSRKEAYLADITYGTNNEFGFDYLRDNMAYDPSQIVQRDFNFAILDEIDFILIDEARTPLIISSPAREKEEVYYFFARIAEKLERDKDYIVDEKEKTFEWTDKGQEKVVRFLKRDPWQEADFRTIHKLENAIRAKEFFKLDVDYVIKNGKIIIVDEFTGRLMPGRRWSEGIHQAIEAKEHERGHREVRVETESITLATITFQNFFKKYKKLAGMTGTAASAAEEFEKIYGLEVVVIPTHRPMIRKDYPDKIFKTEKAKFKAIVEEVKKRYQKGQPVLIGTRSIEKNEYLSRLLKKEGILHQVLNAKHHEKEGQIIAQAGKLKAVTVATNMAGRGVDILLGGNPQNKEEAEKVKKLGGLFVLGTERHEARRIDDQLRGRAGRQGDPGESQFFISLEDELIRVFGGDKIKSLMEKFNIPEDLPIESPLVSRVIDEIQARVEGIHFDMRKRLLEYDLVMEKHREYFYKKRKEILFAKDNALEKILENILEKMGQNKDLLKEKKEKFGPQFFQMAKFFILSVYDTFWVDYLETMEHLKASVSLRSYGGLDPLVEYKREGNLIFKKMLERMEKIIGQGILSLRPAENIETKKVGRNDPCPCGSGKKYKKCCWPKYGY